MKENYGRLIVCFQLQRNSSLEMNHSVMPAFSKIKHHFRCNRCGNQDPTYFAKGPCVYCRKDCYYCLACLAMGKVKQCSMLIGICEKNPPFNTTPVAVCYKGKLSKNQQEISDQLVALWQKKQVREHLVWAVTGAGKTEMVFELIRQVLAKGGRVAFAAPRIDVCNEIAPRLQQAFATQEMVVLHSLVSNHYKRVPLTVATTHQLLRFYRAFDLLIVDEVDAFPYAHSTMLRWGVQQAVAETGMILYLTATPSADEEKRIKKGELSVSLLPARFHRHALIVPQLRWMGNGDRLFRHNRLPFELKKWIRQHLENKIPFLLFVASLAKLSQIAVILKRYFPKACFQVVSSKEKERLTTIQGMREGRYDFLITTTILERGVTFAAIDVAVVEAHDPIFTKAVLVQIAGRVGRLSTCPNGEVIFFHHGKTKAMLHARREIQQLNQWAKQKGLIDE